jgi:CHAT domain-containing protein
LAQLYFERGLFILYEKYLFEAFEMERRLLKEDNPNLAISFNNLGNYYNIIGKVSKAESCYLEALKMLKRLYKNDNPDLFITLSNISSFYFNIGRLTEAGKYLSEAGIIAENIYNDDNIYMAGYLNNLANYLIEINKYSEAEIKFNESLEIIKKIYKEDNQNLAKSFLNYGVLCVKMRKFEKADSLFEEAYNISKKVFTNDNPFLISCLVELTKNKCSINDYVSVDENFVRAINMSERLFTYPHILKAETCFSYYDILSFKNRDSLANNFLIKGIDNYLGIIENNFMLMSEQERSQFLNTFKDNFEKFNSFAVKRIKDNHSIATKVFDNQLLLKGILLNSTKKVYNSVLNSGDTSLINLFESWKFQRNDIAKYSMLTNEELKQKNINVDSLTNLANDIEKELATRSEAFKTEYQKKIFNYEDVKSNLKKGEAAVEIVRFRYNNKDCTDTVYYAALIATKDLEIPRAIFLDNGKELETIYLEKYRNSIIDLKTENDLFGLYWKPIADELKKLKVNKIYLSPDGVYNQINIATLYNPQNKKFVIDEYDIALIGSSRDLCKDIAITKNDNKKITLIGNPVFNLDEVKYDELATKVTSKYQAKSYFSDNAMDNLTRDNISALPGTQQEIVTIANLFEKNKWTVEEFTKEEAIEENVKNIINPTVLHIATHGKFLDDVKPDDDLNSFDMGNQKFIENPLMRSMLLFSGAETFLNHNDSMTSHLTIRDDGLFTAYEAMNMNLDKTELVVLSACNTGLGKVQNGEGVYGLQRAFIQAGAKTLIMSLWSVNDKTTQQLMTTFYEKWLSGKSKRQAFKEAQLDLKKQFKHPFFWGAFVMVGE